MLESVRPQNICHSKVNKFRQQDRKQHHGEGCYESKPFVNYFDLNFDSALFSWKN